MRRIEPHAVRRVWFRVSVAIYAGMPRHPLPNRYHSCCTLGEVAGAVFNIGIYKRHYYDPGILLYEIDPGKCPRLAAGPATPGRWGCDTDILVDC